MSLYRAYARVAQKPFYKTLISAADKRFDEHLAAVAAKEK